MSNYKNYRVVATCFSNVHYFETSEAAEYHAGIHGGRIECYVYGWGWVQWTESMREPEVTV
jgi:hypothetical protein